MYSSYYLVLFSSSDLCAAYDDYFSALTQIIRSPWNTDEIGGRCHFLPPVAPQETMLSLPIRHPLPIIHPACPWTVRSVPSDPSGQSGPSLQANFFHTVNCTKGLISTRYLMINLPHLKIERVTTKPSPIQNMQPSLPLCPPCTALVLTSLFLNGYPKTSSTIPSNFTADAP